MTEEYPQDQIAQNEPESSSETVTIRVTDQEGGEVYFKVKKDTPVRKLMEAYCTRKGTDQSSIRFLYDGTRLLGTETARSLEMDNEDIIDAVLQQTGG